ncbi:MAG: hypothetical protein AVDCRST_MAG77-5498, partial [uncultured Chloroflexi bacterium]
VADMGYGHRLRGEAEACSAASSSSGAAIGPQGHRVDPRGGDLYLAVHRADPGGALAGREERTGSHRYRWPGGRGGARSVRGGAPGAEQEGQHGSTPRGL